MPRTMSYESWEKKYVPVVNHFHPRNEVSYDGFLFETYGPEYTYITDVPKNRVWTLLDVGSKNPVICAGYHYVNRLGYFVTQEPWETGDETARS